MRYTGEQEIFLNGMPVDHRRIYIFPKGSFIRIPKGTPIYYTDVVGHFLTDADSPRISYEVKNVGYTFKNGTIGLRNININEEQGRLIGIMGASGAKTTLLNVLSGIEVLLKERWLLMAIAAHPKGGTRRCYRTNSAG